MLAPLLALTLVATDSLPAPLSPIDTAHTAAADTAITRLRIVRSFPAIEVRALVHDMRSSQTVHLIPGAVLHSFPVDNLAEVLGLQAGVVAQAEELHVRGGRAGETASSLDGLGLNEPLRHRALEVPLLALRSAELVSGAPEAQYGGALAGVLNLRSADPGERLAAEWRWQSDGRLDTHFDRVAARVGSPLHLGGLGFVAAGDATLDDTWLPALRTKSRREIAGLSLGWRAENRLLGFAKLASVEHPERFSAEVLVGRAVHEPYSPNWSLDGWTFVPVSPKVSPTYSATPKPGYQRYRAADHLGITDENHVAMLIKGSALRAASRATASFGWLRTRAITSLGGGHERTDVSHRANYGNASDRERFYALWGDYPLYRESGSDVFTLRGDAETATRREAKVMAGVGFTHEDVSLRELDWMPLGRGFQDQGGAAPLDSVRAYDARAPGGYAYVQARWPSGGMILNTGLRAEYFTPGAEAERQTLPGRSRGIWSFSPRLGIAYPISVRDVFSLAYVRVQQAPGRDYLYDQRRAISNRQPLGNPALEPSTLVSYEAAVKHVFGPAWALQGSVFFRDVFGQIGARDEAIPEGLINLRYANEDESNAAGFEWSVIHAAGERRRFEARYTWMQAWGNESRPEGDPYGPVRQARTPAVGEQPLSWDRRHSIAVSGVWAWRDHVTIAWSTAVGSPLPWTPKPRRRAFTDFGLINSQRLDWTENTNVNVHWSPPRLFGLMLGVEARNLFDNRSARLATVDGYPNPLINTIYDDYGAYRTETGSGGGAYWSQLPGTTAHWVAVHDPRLMNPPRAVRASIGARW